jgi:glycosyltransferase involved in cell wall biosynthesis
MSEKKVLFITPVIPLPPTGGGTRSFQVLQAISLYGKVDLLCFQPLTTHDKQLLKEVCFTIYSAPSKRFIKKNSYFRNKLILFFPFLFSTQLLYDVTAFLALKAPSQYSATFRKLLFTWLFFWLRLRKDAAFAMLHLCDTMRYVQSIIKKIDLSEYHSFVADLSYIYPVFQRIAGISNANVIINSHNVEFDLLEQVLNANKNDKIKKWTDWQVNLMKQLEVKSLKSASVFLCCSEQDKKRFLLLHNANPLLVVPNGVDLDYFHPKPKKNQIKTLLFTGTMNYLPNQEAATWLIEDIFRKLRLSFPDLRLVIAGKHADKLEISNIPEGVQLINNPDDMRPYFNEAYIVVVPLKKGSGTRLKILEAAAMKKPIVSTSIGAEGLIELSPHFISLADDTDKFVEAVRYLLEHPLEAEIRSQEISKWVKQYYSWETIRGDLNLALTSNFAA